MNLSMAIRKFASSLVKVGIDHKGFDPELDKKKRYRVNFLISVDADDDVCVEGLCLYEWPVSEDK